MLNVCEISYNISLQQLGFCKFLLNIQDKEISLTFPQLLYLRSKLFQITRTEKISEVINQDNFVLLFVADKKHLLLLDIPQLLDLKNEVAIFFEEINSVSF